MVKIHNYWSLIIAAVVIAFDQITKLFFLNLDIGTTINIIPNILTFTVVHNFGAGFGLFQGARVFFIIFSFVVLAGICIKWKKIPSKISAMVPLGLILGGIIGNLIDRIVHGYVIDFIDFQIWPVFNVADSAISIAVVWLIIFLWKK